jgi:hypothetical protein
MQRFALIALKADPKTRFWVWTEVVSDKFSDQLLQAALPKTSKKMVAVYYHFLRISGEGSESHD